MNCMLGNAEVYRPRWRCEWFIFPLASSQTTSSLLEQKKPGQQFVKEAGCSLELQLCVEASNSPEWPLDAPCAQGKLASTLHFPASPAIPQKQQGACYFTDAFALLQPWGILPVLAVFSAVTSNCALPVHLKLCTALAVSSLSHRRECNSVWSPLSKSYQPLTLKLSTRLCCKN